MTSITQNSKTTTAVYDSASRLTQSILPNGISKNYTYDVASQLSSITGTLGLVLVSKGLWGIGIAFCGSLAFFDTQKFQIGKPLRWQLGFPKMG